MIIVLKHLIWQQGIWKYHTFPTGKGSQRALYWQPGSRLRTHGATGTQQTQQTTQVQMPPAMTAPSLHLNPLNPGTSCFSAVDWACWLAMTHRSRQWNRATRQRMDAPYRGLSLGSSPMSWDAWVATSPLYLRDACPRSVQEGGQWGRARAAAERRARLKS